MSVVAFQCPNCGTSNPISNRFCIKCGANLITKCPRCGEENFIGAEFCGTCGVEVATATPILGLPIDKVKAWREIFATLNWLPSAESDSQLVQLWNSKVADLGIDPVDLAREPTIFAAPISKIDEIGFFNAWIAKPRTLVPGAFAPEWETRDGILWATSWRLLLWGRSYSLLPGRREARHFVLPYEDLVSFKVSFMGQLLTAFMRTGGGSEGGVALHRKDGRRLALSPRMPRTGFLDLTAVMAAQDPAVKAFAIKDSRDKRQIAEAFEEILKRFFEEVSKLSAEAQKRS